MDPVSAILEQLKADPSGFQRSGGYERLLALLQEGHSPASVKALLTGNDSFIGDLLWTVCELDDQEPYIEESARHIDSSDPGTAAYAIEVLLRAAQGSKQLQAALQRLESAPVPVLEHSILVLASQGLSRAREVFSLGGWTWAAALIDELLRGSRHLEATLETLASDRRQDRVLVGLVVATVASEKDGRAVRILEESKLDWVRKFAEEPRRMFQHKWRALDERNMV
jgi:hypothetical protein